MKIVEQATSLNRKQKTILVIVLAFLLLIVCSYSIVSYRFSRTSAISRLQKAITKNDAEAAAGLIESSDKKLKINERTIQSFLTYLNKNQDKFHELSDTLYKQAASIGGKENQDCWNYYLILKKPEKSFLGFGRYYFEMKPCYVDFSTRYPFTQLYVDGKLYVTTPGLQNFNNDPLTCGPFVQGEHKVKAVCTGFLGKAEAEKTFNFITVYDKAGSYNYFCKIDTDAKFTYLSCSVPYAEIFIDGKDSGKKFTDIRLFGPIKSNDSVKVSAVAELPWGSFKSAETTINYNLLYTMRININPDKNIVNQLKQAVADYNNKILTALLKKQDSSYLGSNEIIKKRLDDEFKNMSSKGIYFSGHYLYSIIDPESVTISDYSDEASGNLYQYSAELQSMDYYTQDYGEPGASVFCTSKNGISYQYKASYNSEKKTWSITDIGLNTN